MNILIIEVIKQNNFFPINLFFMQRWKIDWFNDKVTYWNQWVIYLCQRNRKTLTNYHNVLLSTSLNISTSHLLRKYVSTLITNVNFAGRILGCGKWKRYDSARKIRENKISYHILFRVYNWKDSKVWILSLSRSSDISLWAVLCVNLMSYLSGLFDAAICF